ncbi:MAG: hypothetical protein EZS28_034060 [Streblomastix strix]|uniref:Uncharacterized protein n=2 Tax=Streblomastix strix TaxID=222440 RepID=A0A5J4UJK1_9EUKA|nr:MAG: hypothetical protein EZS28_034060 [Streblomastix strix]
MVFQYTCLIVIIFFALDSQPRVQIPIPNPQTPVFSNSNTNHFTTSELLNSTTEITNPHKTANFDIQPDEEIAYTPTSLAITMRQNQILLVQVAMLTAFVEIMNLVGSTGFVVISDIAAIGYSLLQKLLRRKSDDYLNF